MPRCTIARFITLVLAILVAPLAADAQPGGKVHRVALVLSTSPVSEWAGPEPAHPAVRAFLHEMGRLGYVEGKNLVFERRSAEGKFERYGEIVAELLHLQTDVIVGSGNDLPRAAKQVTHTVPIVMANSMSPVEAGLVLSLARPGTNITGLTVDAGPEIEGKLLALLKEALPSLSRVAFLGTKADWEHPFGKATQAAAERLGMLLVHAETTPGQYHDAFAALARERPDALFVASAPTHYPHRRRIVDLAVENRLPGMYPFREFVEMGV